MAAARVTSLERHYTPAEIAEAWNLSVRTVVRMFEREPGVIAHQGTLGKHARRHRTLRIPQSVVDRVHRSRQVA
jgi:predicted fused transcriptional regulator/phosphomethylpyrimidine kinase